MKILVFEYVTGGGLLGEELPASLAREGDMMLNALLQDLTQLPNIELLISRDYRLPAPFCAGNSRIVTIDERCSVLHCFDTLMAECDAVWPIAPETGSVLQNYCFRVEAAGRVLLSSPAAAVAVCGDKLLTYETLESNAIPCVATSALPAMLPTEDRRWVVKSRDGAGCSAAYIVTGQQDYRHLVAALPNPDDFIFQAFIGGKPVSLSALFKQGRAALLSYNEQLICQHGNAFELRGCIVNAPCCTWDRYRQIADQIARVLPDLWGYAGVDIIESNNGPLVVEINPRLTTSYAGLRQALQSNVAGLVLDLLHGDVPYTAHRGRQVEVHIAQGQTDEG